MILSELKALREAKNMTLQEVSKLSNVPLSTVQRIFSGDTESPSAQALSSIVKALGGSMDKILGIPVANDPRHEDTRLIALYERGLKIKNRWITVLFTLVVILILFVFWLLVFDGPNGDIGLIRY